MNKQTPCCVAEATVASSSDVRPSRQRMLQSIHLIWLDASMDQSKKDSQDVLAQFQSIANDINCFTQPDECIDFLTDVNDMKSSLIVSNTLGQQIVPIIHDIPQLYGIYIFPGSTLEDEQWTEQWMKVKGMNTEIKSITESFEQATQQYNQDSIAISYVMVDENNSIQDLNQLEPTFMYTQIFKEILLEMNDSQHSFKDMILFWRDYYIGNNSKQNDIDEFERDYHPQSSIWWYTREKFIYEILNRALRLMEADTIINMGFFIRHLHHQIEALHRQQVHDHHEQSFIVYRGQGLSTRDFDKLLKSKGHLISFNNFLSTSMHEDISRIFAESSSTNVDTIGVLFKMTINPPVSTAPFASIQKLSYFQTEEEVLFSMHTVFRVNEIIKLNNSSSLYQVDLTLTADDDQDLRTLTEQIRKDTAAETGWRRLGLLLVTLNQLDRAEELYNILLEQALNEMEKSVYYSNIGHIKDKQGDYTKAIKYFEKSREIREKNLPANHPLLAICYSCIGMLYNNMKEDSKALLFCKKSLEIQEKARPLNLPELAISYNNIGVIYHSMGEYLEALSNHDKSLQIRETNLPANHPDLAQSYNNIGSTYHNMKEYSKALLFYGKAQNIFEKTLPSNHPLLSICYNNIAAVYHYTNEYLKALSFYEKSLEIDQKLLPVNHCNFVSFYNNIGNMHYNMGEYKKALSNYEKALQIRQKNLPVNHPDFARSYNNIGKVYVSMGEYSKAILFYEKDLEICQKNPPENHPSLDTSYNNIGLLYHRVGEYTKALSFYEKSLKICQKTRPANDPSLATSYNIIGLVYHRVGEYSKALVFFEKGLTIYQNTLPANDPSLATSYNNVASTYDNMKEYSKALSFYKKSLEIQQRISPLNQSLLTTSYDNIASTYYNLNEYSKALLFYEKVQDIFEKTLPSNHPELATCYNNIGGTYNYLGEYSKSISFYQRALDIFQNSLPSNHSHILSIRKSIAFVKNKM